MIEREKLNEQLENIFSDYLILLQDENNDDAVWDALERIEAFKTTLKNQFGWKGI